MIALPAAVPGWPAGSAPRAPANFRVEAYARGLGAPDTLLVLPNGDVLVIEHSSAGSRLTLLRGRAGEGTADRQFALYDSKDPLRGLVLRRGRLYLGRGDGLLSCPFLVGQTRLHGRCHTPAPRQGERPGAEALRAIALAPDESSIYAGAAWDAGAAAAGRTPVTAIGFERLSERVHGSVRGDPWALAFEPTSGVLWVAAAGAAGAQATDWLAAVPHGAAVDRADVALGAHAEPRALVFYQRAQFPKPYRGGAFLAERTGKVVFVPFAAGRPAGAVQDFLTGFVDEADGTVHGRPAALAVGNDGTLLVADEAGNLIWRVRFKCAACTPDPPPPPRRRAATTRP